MITETLRNRLKIRMENVGSDLLEEPFEPRKSFFPKFNRAPVNHRKNTRYRSGVHRRGNSFVGRGFSQRVLVKIHYKKHRISGGGGTAGVGNLRGHLNYITRKGAGIDGEEKAVFFGAEFVGEEELSKSDFYQKCENDRHHFRMIISPENAHEIEDMQGYVRDVMVRVELDLDTKLEWVSAVHYDTDNPHAHVIVRGKNDRGEDLVIAPDYIARGVRGRAEEVASELLGERTLEQVQESMRGEVEAMRATSLDRYISENGEEAERVCGAEISDSGGDTEGIKRSSTVIRFDLARDLEGVRNEFHGTLIRERLKFLSSTALAQDLGQGRYELPVDFVADLYEINAQREVKRQLSYVVPDEAERVQIYKMQDGQGAEIEGRVERVAFRDELYDNKYLLVRDGSERLHYVPMALNDYTERIKEGAIVRISPPEKSTGKADYNIAEIAEGHNGIYDHKIHMQAVLERQAHLRAGESGFISDVESYIGHHETRLETLVKAGIVVEAGEGRYRVPDDLLEQGAALNAEMQRKVRKSFYPSVTMLSEKPVESQIGAHAKTFLDLEIYKYQKGYDLSYRHADKVTLFAMQQRMEWLEKEGYGYRRSADGQFVLRDDALKRLEEKELSSFKARLEAENNAHFAALDPQQTKEVYMRGFVTLHSGHYAVVLRDDQKWAVVRTRNNARYWRAGEPLKVIRGQYGLELKRDILDRSPSDELARIARQVGKETVMLDDDIQHRALLLGGLNLRDSAYAVIEKDNKISMVQVREYPPMGQNIEVDVTPRRDDYADVTYIQKQKVWQQKVVREQSKDLDQDKELGD
jgi:hypothetical protein